MVRFPLACALVALAAPPLIAQVPAGGEFRVNTYTTGDQHRPSVAMDGAGRFAVSWTMRHVMTAPFSVHAQRFDASGAPLGVEFPVNTAPDAALGVLATRHRGALVAVWHGNDGIRAQRYDPSGAPEGAEFQVNTYTTSTQYRPDVAPLPGGGFVVCWSFSAPNYPHRILVRRFDAHGTALGAEVLASGPPAGGVLHNFPAVSSAWDGRFIVTWNRTTTASTGVFGRRFDAAGNPIGAEFQLNLLPAQGTRWHDVAMAADGRFLVVWEHPTGDGDLDGIRGRLFDPAGAPVGGEFTVNQGTAGRQYFPSAAAAAMGDFVVAWLSGRSGAYDIVARRFGPTAAPRGGDFRANSYTTGKQALASVGSDSAGNFVVAWSSLAQDGSDWGVYAQRFGGLVPSALLMDTAASQSDGNGVLEPGETVDARPAWRNVNGAAQAFSGTLSGFAGPAGATYTLTDGAAGYGTVPDGATGACSDCYGISLSAPSSRPAWHWDGWAVELLAPDAQGQRMFWPLHIGDTFSDVPRSNPFYRFVETLVHNHVVLGCASAQYCPGSPTTREQMAVFVLVARDRAGDPPPPCTTPLFTDVPASSGYCRWIEELARSGVVTGCGGGAYCPSQPVSREQMAVFVLRALDPALDPPVCTTPMFGDVPASSPFCRWIEELARRGVVAGCGGGNYCPQAPVARDQMAVFISTTFGLALYGP